jgi:predicted transcriptional regulator
MGAKSYDVKLLRALASEEKKRVVLLLLRAQEALSASDVAFHLKVSVSVAGYVLNHLVKARAATKRWKNGKKVYYYRISRKAGKKLLSLAELFLGEKYFSLRQCSG